MLPNQDGAPGRWPQHVALFGGGRWARVILNVLCEVVPPSTAITVHSPHNAAGIAQWLLATGLGERVRAQADSPQWSTRSRAAIVANAAADHVQTAMSVIKAGVPLLVEKPLALRAEDARILAHYAERFGAALAPAHVFVFARYVHNLAEEIARAGGARSLYVLWTDPAAESRHGETKRYDSSLPVFADWLPHVVAIIGVLLRARPTRWSDLHVDHGGAEVVMQVTAGDIPCRLHLRRNAATRARVIGVETSAGAIELDFSSEPGELRSGGEIRTADAQWTAGRRPLACMLSAFLQWSLQPHPDPRLALAPALDSCELCDQILAPYRAQQITWLAAHFPGSREHEPAVHYALTELVQAHAALPSESLNRRMAVAFESLSQGDARARLHAAASAPDPMSAFTALLH